MQKNQRCSGLVQREHAYGDGGVRACPWQRTSGSAQASARARACMRRRTRVRVPALMCSRTCMHERACSAPCHLSFPSARLCA
eukprot:6211141-Pleurochrysis_carterae.AAC.1